MKKTKRTIFKYNREQDRAQMARSILLLLKLDAKGLLDRIVYRREEFMLEFSKKRTREHFKEIFFSRYRGCRIDSLKWCTQDVILALDNFHNKVDELWWYLNHTQDMAKTAEDQACRHIRALKNLYNTVELYTDAEIEVKNNFLQALEYPKKEQNRKMENEVTNENIDADEGDSESPIDFSDD